MLKNLLAAVGLYVVCKKGYAWHLKNSELKAETARWGAVWKTTADHREPDTAEKNAA